MSKTIKLELKKSLILEAVKADTYQSGQVDKAADPVKNASLAYNEQAGDENYQERKLIRFLRSGLARFAAAMNEFVDSENGSITYTLTDESDDIVIRVVVSNRYNNGLAQPLSSFAEEYVSYTMDYMWWQSIKPALAKDYFGYAENTLTQIRLCLAKTAPVAATPSYVDVKGSVETEPDTNPDESTPDSGNTNPDESTPDSGTQSPTTSGTEQQQPTEPITEGGDNPSAGDVTP